MPAQKNDGVVYDPETILLMKNALDEAWGMLNTTEQAHTLKSVLAERILHAAAQGERDPVRLRCSALLHVVVPGIVPTLER